MTVRLWSIAKPFLKVGTFGFGGGMGMLAMIRNECVKARKWITDDEMAVAVAIGQMIPGPFVPNYCQFIGHKLRGARGATVATVALLLPSFIIMIVLAWVYLTYRTLPGINFIFKGIGAVMTAIIIWAAYDMGRILIRGWRSMAVFIFSLSLFLLKFDPVLTVLLSGAVMVIFDHVRSPRIFLAVPVFMFDLHRAWNLFWIFLKTGAVTFGGGYAAIPFLEREVCDVRHWLTAREFMAGFALGQITPGPVAITATFIGFQVMGLPGAFISTLAMFLPSFLIFQVVIRLYKRVEHNKYIISFLNGIKSAIVAVLLSTGIYFALTNWHSIPSAILGVTALALLVFFKVQPVILIVAGVIFGLFAR
jgi:chromate transporter